MKVVVTGVAGFIGSHIAQHWLDLGDDVVGIDAFTDYYSPSQKRANLAAVKSRGGALEFVEGDLLSIPLNDILRGCDVLYHQAGQPGVRASWSDFEPYVQHNIVATQAVLEASLKAGVGKLIYASSSSVYGNAPRYPTRESDPLAPYNPYGVTKLAGEHLVTLYGTNFGLPTVSLRYFTVYGPRQRPDMAIHRLINAAMLDKPFPLYGDGSAIRSFTYVQDVVAANVLAATTDVPSGTVVNVAGAGQVSMTELLELVGETVGRAVSVDVLPSKPGDVARTGGSIEEAGRLLGWQPEVDLATGLMEQVAWHRQNVSSE